MTADPGFEYKRSSIGYQNVGQRKIVVQPMQLTGTGIDVR